MSTPIDAPLLRWSQSAKLTADCWCAIAQIATNVKLPFYDTTLQGKPRDASIHVSPDLSSVSFSHPQPTLFKQRQAVRALLYKLLTELGINDRLDESQYPYRLVNLGYFICFSHSAHYVALIMHRNRPAAVDIEMGLVRLAVAQRFYHPQEINQLNQLPAQSRLLVCSYLWQIKECIVKIEQSSLIPILRRSCAAFIQPLHDYLENPTQQIALKSFDLNPLAYHASSLQLQHLPQIKLRSESYSVAALFNLPAVMIF